MLKADNVNGIKTKFVKSYFDVAICGWVSNLIVKVVHLLTKESDGYIIL